MQCVAVCCSVLQCVAVCCSVLQCVAVCCSVLQCVAVCCSAQSFATIRIALDKSADFPEHLLRVQYELILHLQPIPFGWHSRKLFQSSKLKARTSLYAEMWQKRCLSFELCETAFENVTSSGIDCTMWIVSDNSNDLLQFVAVCCSVLQCVMCCNYMEWSYTYYVNCIWQ